MFSACLDHSKKGGKDRTKSGLRMEQAVSSEHNGDEGEDADGDADGDDE